EYPEGTVIEQLVRGYMIDDQVLRYAMVKVAMPGENESENTDSESETSENSQE
ncbi:MAG: nucleotide exchange factor GrpE, partial [Cyanobacteria bacterium J149]